MVLLFGQEEKSTISWFNFFGLKFQPSEFAKFSTALILAKVFDSSNLKVDSVKSLIKVSTLILVPFILILFQGDTGTALVYFSFFLVFHVCTCTPHSVLQIPFHQCEGIEQIGYSLV